MSSKLEINRQRLFTQGFRKYLQSLTHGALVDFILRGGDLSFSPAQERQLLLEELADSQERHARATKKINELVHANRELREALAEGKPVNTQTAFDIETTGATDETPFSFKIVDLDTNTVLFDGNLSDHDDGLHLLIDALLGLPGGQQEDRSYVSLDEFKAANPHGDVYSIPVFLTTKTARSDITNAIRNLLDDFEPYVFIENSPLPSVKVVQIAFETEAASASFIQEARDLNVRPRDVAEYLVHLA